MFYVNLRRLATAVAGLIMALVEVATLGQRRPLAAGGIATE